MLLFLSSLKTHCSVSKKNINMIRFIWKLWHMCIVFLFRLFKVYSIKQAVTVKRSWMILLIGLSILCLSSTQPRFEIYFTMIENKSHILKGLLTIIITQLKCRKIRKLLFVGNYRCILADNLLESIQLYNETFDVVTENFSS